MKNLLFYLVIISLLSSCKIEKQGRFITYHYPSKDTEYIKVSEYSKEFLTMLIYDTISNYVTYIVAPITSNRTSHLFIIRSNKYALNDIKKENFMLGTVGYDTYGLDLTTGKLQGCDYPSEQFFIPKYDETGFKIAYYATDSTFNELRYNGNRSTSVGAYDRSAEFYRSCLFYHYQDKIYPERFPEPLIRNDKINYKKLSYPPAGKANEKRLRPALEALFSGRPILEVDSLLKVGYGELNKDTWELKGNDGQ